MSELKDKFGELLVIPLCFVVLALFEWVRWWTAAQPNPYVPTVSALIAILYAWRKGVPLLANIKNLRLGRDGERAVGQMLEQLRGKGYQVFHDIPGDGFNIDHAIVGPAGVFTIETKTRSKLTRGGSSILYDGETVRIGNGVPTHEPLSQARAQARCLAHLLNDCRSSKLIVRPVVVFPEWYVEQIGNRKKGDIWVINEKLL